MTKRKLLICATICMSLLILVVIITIAFIYMGKAYNSKVDSFFGTPSYPVFRSSVDKDGDGLDDQSDVLQGAKDYIATEPQYKSKYYAGGYPDDEHGVCTDVVAFALKAAGYDLKELIDEDIKSDPSAYNMKAEERDSNIDFRRVGNQRVWLSRHAVELTLDLSDPEDWQGGDIIVYGNHVAMLSDRRNHEGMPYLIHLYNPVQTAVHNYETNSLKKRADEIIGHYRISE